MLKFSCPKCDWSMESSASRAGEKITCPNCSNVTIAPAADAQTDKAEGQSAPATSRICPHCKHTEIAIVKRGFGWIASLIACVCVGPFGFLVGAVGSGELIQQCLKCGHKSRIDATENPKVDAFFRIIKYILILTLGLGFLLFFLGRHPVGLLLFK